MTQIKEKAVDDFLDALASSSATPIESVRRFSMTLAAASARSLVREVMVTSAPS